MIAVDEIKKEWFPNREPLFFIRRLLI